VLIFNQIGENLIFEIRFSLTGKAFVQERTRFFVYSSVFFLMKL